MICEVTVAFGMSYVQRRCSCLFHARGSSAWHLAASGPQCCCVVAVCDSQLQRDFLIMCSSLKPCTFLLHIEANIRCQCTRTAWRSIVQSVVHCKVTACCQTALIAFANVTIFPPHASVRLRRNESRILNCNLLKKPFIWCPQHR